MNELKQANFINLGWDVIKPLSDVTRYYVSEKGSRFSFFYIPNGVISEPLLRPSFKRQTNLFTKLERFSNFIIGYVDINENALDYFFEEDLLNEDNVINVCLCLVACNTDLIVQKLNKQIHPVFRITNFTINEEETETQGITSVNLNTNIEGSVSDFYGFNDFSMLLIYKTNDNNEEAKILCSIDNPLEIQNNYIINCDGVLGPTYKKGYIAYLQPFYAIERSNKPFEVIINKTYIYPPESPEPTDVPTDIPTDNQTDKPLPTGSVVLIQVSLWSFISLMLLF